MEGREKPHVEKYKEIMNDWNYDASATLTSLLVSDLENNECLIFTAQREQFPITKSMWRFEGAFIFLLVCILITWVYNWVPFQIRI
jgi:hypothetical protein